MYDSAYTTYISGFQPLLGPRLLSILKSNLGTAPIWKFKIKKFSLLRNLSICQKDFLTHTRVLYIITILFLVSTKNAAPLIITEDAPGSREAQVKHFSLTFRPLSSGLTLLVSKPITIYTYLDISLHKKKKNCKYTIFNNWV